MTLICIRRTPCARLCKILLTHRGPVDSSQAAGTNVDSVWCLCSTCSYQFAAQEHGEGHFFYSACTRPFLGYYSRASETYFRHHPAAYAEAFYFAYFNLDNGTDVTEFVNDLVVRNPNVYESRIYAFPVRYFTTCGILTLFHWHRTLDCLRLAIFTLSTCSLATGLSSRAVDVERLLLVVRARVRDIYNIRREAVIQQERFYKSASL